VKSRFFQETRTHTYTIFSDGQKLTNMKKITKTKKTITSDYARCRVWCADCKRKRKR